MISFLLNDKLVQIEQSKADQTLLNYLRNVQKLTGSKEGCASGDCGACTIVIAEIVKDSSDSANLSYRAINSCVTFLSALHGKQLITVEHLAEGSALHPVQQAMVDQHGSQCGFCTPGFVMSMFAFYHQDIQPEREQIDLALSGNLCRCTGYRPIIEAAKQACSNKNPDKFDLNQTETIGKLETIAPSAGINGLMMPKNRSELTTMRQQHPQARLFAGSTDLALEVTQQLNDIDQLISLSRVAELNQLEQTEHALIIGSAIPLASLETQLLQSFPELSELLWRFASTPIRNQATLGGNVANASPIGDMPPVLLALDAQINVDNGQQRRTIPASEFFSGYRQTKLLGDEWIESISLPLKTSNTQLRAYKISKRFEDDISAVCAVFKLELAEDTVQMISTGFGGVAATPACVAGLSQALVGKPWSDKQTLELGKQLLSQAFNPIDDVRASAQYRQDIVLNLWQRFWLETNRQANSIETRVVNHPGTANA